MSESVKGGATFFTRFQCDNADGTMDVGWEALTTFDSLAEALEEVVTEVEGDGLEAYIYELRAVRRITRGDVLVETITRRKGP